MTKHGSTIRGEQVRVMQVRELSSKRHLAKVASDNPGWIDFLCGVKDLQYLQSRGYDPIIHDRAWQEIAPTLGLDIKNPVPKDLMTAWLLPALAVALEGVRMTFWYANRGKDRSQRLLPGLYCPDLKTATAARWLLAADIRVCLRCAKVFLADRPKQTACSIECRESHRVARFRARKARAA